MLAGRTNRTLEAATTEDEPESPPPHRQRATCNMQRAASTPSKLQPAPSGLRLSVRFGL